MSERYVIIGHGSIGKRHERNLLALRPQAAVVVVDPAEKHAVSLNEALDYPDLTGAIVASPTEYHLEQLLMLHARKIPTYLEKPVCSSTQWRASQATRDELGYISRQAWKCGMGFQYRYHPMVDKLLGVGRPDHLSFVAQDDLMRRYGAHVSEIMASHSVDLALWLLGEQRFVEALSNGHWFSAAMYHRQGGVSSFDLRMDCGPRLSTLTVEYERGGREVLELRADEGMYLAALGEWLRWVISKVRPQRLATLADGLRVMDVICSGGEVR